MCKVIDDGKSAKTIESYVGDIKAFIEFLGSKGVAMVIYNDST